VKLFYIRLKCTNDYRKRWCWSYLEMKNQEDLFIFPWGTNVSSLGNSLCKEKQSESESEREGEGGEGEGERERERATARSPYSWDNSCCRQ